MAARLSALCAGHTLPTGFFIFKDSWYSFLLEAESTPGPVWWLHSDPKVTCDLQVKFVWEVNKEAHGVNLAWVATILTQVYMDFSVSQPR
jgi:hypothetical protein